MSNAGTNATESFTAQRALTGRAPFGVFGFSLVTFILFWPTGLFAVLNSIRSREAFADGDSAGYASGRSRALVWAWVSIGVVTALVVAYFALSLAVLAASL